MHLYELIVITWRSVMNKTVTILSLKSSPATAGETLEKQFWIWWWLPHPSHCHIFSLIHNSLKSVACGIPQKHLPSLPGINSPWQWDLNPQPLFNYTLTSDVDGWVKAEKMLLSGAAIVLNSMTLAEGRRSCGDSDGLLVAPSVFNLMTKMFTVNPPGGSTSGFSSGFE